MIKKFITQLS